MKVRERAKSVRFWTVCAFVVAVAGVAVTWPIYGGGSLWPGLVGNFVASLIAFLLALAWDRTQRQAAESEARKREAEQAKKAIEKEAEQAKKAIEEEEARRATEVRRRLSAVRVEMEQLRESVDATLREHQAAAYYMPDLPTGAWDAGSEALGRLIADYKLVADLSTFYDRVRDLQWRLRFKAEAYSKSEFEGRRFDPMVGALASEIHEDFSELLARVSIAIEKPAVQPFGIIHAVSGGVASAVALGGGGVAIRIVGADPENSSDA